MTPQPITRRTQVKIMEQEPHVLYDFVLLWLLNFLSDYIHSD